MTDIMEYDVLIVGAGPAGLAAAIRLKQLNAEKSICVLEKGAAVGAHSISGAVLEPGPLETLLPEWRSEYPGMKVPALRDEFLLHDPHERDPVSARAAPDAQHGQLHHLARAAHARGSRSRPKALGVDVFPGFAAAGPLFDDAGAVRGRAHRRHGRPEGWRRRGRTTRRARDIHAGTTLIAEGARGSIAKELIKRFDLARGHDPQTYGLGFKELWQLPAGRVQAGLIQHSIGWPRRSQNLWRQLSLSPRQ